VRSDNTYKCIITGEEKYIPPSLAKTKISKYGSVEEYRKYYVSKPAAKLLKQGNNVEQIRKQLNSPDGLPEVDLEVLLKLKLVKINKRKGKKEATEAIERERYLNSQEFRDKMRRIKEERENMSFRDWAEYNTGIGYHRGGTCIRPDIFLTHNNRACDGCEVYEFCMCYGKRLSGEKQKPKGKRKR